MEHKKSILKTVGNKAVLFTNDFHRMSKKMFLKLSFVYVPVYVRPYVIHFIESNKNIYL